MNREQKAAAVAEIADQIKTSDAVFAVDYRGITVAGVAELRGRLNEADATFRVVKNTLTERAADAAGAVVLKDHLDGPTALTFVRGDAAAAAKAIADFQRASGGELLPFKGGLMNGAALDAEQITAISRLPSREVLYGQLVGMVAAPITGLARGLNGLLSGLAVALGGVLEKQQDGSLPAGDAPVAAAPEPEAAEPATAEETPEDPAADNNDNNDNDSDASAAEDETTTDTEE